jgi:hypothetical protein
MFCCFNSVFCGLWHFEYCLVEIMCQNEGIMAAPHSIRRTPPKQELLDTLRGIVTKYVNDHFMEAVQKMVVSMLSMDRPDSAATVIQRIKSGNLLKQHSYAFFHLVCTGVEFAVTRELAGLTPQPKLRSVDSTPAATLALVPIEEVEHQLTFGSLARTFDAAHADALATLNVRLGFMLERDILRISQNPFRPEVLLNAIYAAWCEFEPDAQAHPFMASMLKPEFLFDLAPLYESLNLALQRKGVLPGSVDNLNIRKSDGPANRAQQDRKAQVARQLRDLLGGPDASLENLIPLLPEALLANTGPTNWRPGVLAEAVTQVMPGNDVRSTVTNQIYQKAAAPMQATSSAPLFAWLSQLGAQSLARAAPAGGAPVQMAAHGGVSLDGIAALAALLGQSGAAPTAPAAAGSKPHEVFFLPRLKASLPAGTLTQGDERTFDLLSKVFETVILDDSIPPRVRELIQYLQVPVLKAALQDKEFFFQDAHPARKMIDILSRLGLEEQGSEDHRLFDAAMRSVDRIGRAQEEPGQAVFEQAVAELEAELAAGEKAEQAAIAAPVAEALRAEKRAQAAKAAKAEVSMRLGSGDVAAVVESFLEDKWVTVMTLAYTVEDEKPGAVQNATRTMDDLIWSVKPKCTHEQRRQLIARLPGLLSTLNRWLDVIRWRDAERLQFFAGLADCHANIVRAPIDLSPERQVELAVEAAQKDALHRMRREQELEAAAEAEADEIAHDIASFDVASLERGMWLEFSDGGETRRVKLAWVSPMRSLYIFATSGRQEAFSLPVEKLTEQFRAGTARVVHGGSVVGKALERAVNDTSILAAAGA